MKTLTLTTLFLCLLLSTQPVAWGCDSEKSCNDNAEARIMFLREPNHWGRNLERNAHRDDMRHSFEAMDMRLKALAYKLDEISRKLDKPKHYMHGYWLDRISEYEKRGYIYPEDKANALSICPEMSSRINAIPEKTWEETHNGMTFEETLANDAKEDVK